MVERKRMAAAAMAAAAVALLGTPAAGRADAGGASAGAADGGAAHGPVGLLVHVGMFNGFGGGLQLGADAAGVRASVGWQPHLLLLQRPGQSDELEFRSALLVSPDLYVRLLHPRERTHLGLQGGYRYSSFLGHGGAAGVYVMFGVGPVDLDVTFGVLFFPDGEDRARRDLGAPNAKFGFPGPAVNAGASIALALFP